MLTPSFNVSQTENWISLTLRVPYVKISEADVYFEGNCFKFHCKPYFLHLQLPGKLADNGHAKSSYNVETGTVLVEIGKQCPGEHFPNLEMLTTLLPCKHKQLPKDLGAKPHIEVVGSSGGGAPEEEEEEEFDWEVEQSFPEGGEKVDDGGELLSGLVPYGFAQQQRGVFLRLQEEIPSIVDCPDPDHMTAHERRVGRIADEEAAFSQDHYLADFMDNDYVSILLTFDPPWNKELEKWRGMRAAMESDSKVDEPGPDIVEFTAAERDELKNLPNRTYMLDKATKRSLYLGLVDILFAFAYDFRSTEGEGTVESAWTICKLSSTLSWLEVFRGGVHEVVFCSLRRCLCYPLYRHWQLAMTVLQDLRILFRLGRRKLLQCLLAIRKILNNAEPFYILNNLYITDYTIWLQSASVRQVQRLADELDEVKVEIGSLGWALPELEEAALLTVKEEEEGEGEEEEEERGTESAGVGEQDIRSVTDQLQAISLTSHADSAETRTKPLIEELQSSEEVTSGSEETSSSESSSNSSSSSSSGSEDSEVT